MRSLSARATNKSAKARDASQVLVLPAGIPTDHSFRALHRQPADRRLHGIGSWHFDYNEPQYLSGAKDTLLSRSCSEFEVDTVLVA